MNFDTGNGTVIHMLGKRYGVSGATAARRFDRLQMAAPKILPEVLGIDEFRGNSGGEKFHCILTDIQNRHVADILQTRLERDLIDYFKKYDRSTVKYFVSDMYKPYAEIAKTYFPGTIHVIDRYHWVRQATWAFEKVRKDIQKKFPRVIGFISSIAESCFSSVHRNYPNRSCSRSISCCTPLLTFPTHISSKNSSIAFSMA
jgi:transposase